MTDSFVAEIDLKFEAEIREYLHEQGFSFTTPPYTIFSAKKEGVSLTLYQSGKLVVQGKNKDALIQYYLEPEILKSLDYSYPTANLDLTPRIGVDEAGKGDFFGPLCIAGVYADSNGIKELVTMGVKDSKRFGDPAIQKLAKTLKEKVSYECIVLFPEKYNELYARFNNLNSLLGWGHATVIEKLHEKTSCKEARIDQFGGKHIVENAIAKKNLSLHLVQNHKGESDPVIAAASILARDAFLNGLEKLSKQYDIPFPKGASQEVVRAGQKFLKQYNKSMLPSVAKTHFKTATALTEMIQ